MMYRKDTRIVLEALFKQHVQRPQGLGGDRKRRRTKANNLFSAGSFDRCFGSAQVLAKLVRGQGIQRAVKMTVTGNLVTSQGHLADKGWFTFSHPSEDEKRRNAPFLGEQFQSSKSVALDARGEERPARAGNGAGKRLDLKIILH